MGNRFPGRVAVSPLLWRSLSMAAALIPVLVLSADWKRGLTLALPLVVGSAAVHAFSAERRKLWLAAGYLILADGLILTLALMGTRRVPAPVFVGLFAVMLVATVVGDRSRSRLASAAVLAGVAAAATGGVFPGYELGLATMLCVPLLTAAVFHFEGLTGELPSSRSAMERARRETSELRALLEITETIGSTLEVSQVMRAIAERVGDLVRSDSCSIVLADQNSQCYVVASKGHPEIDMLELNLDKYPEIRVALETREPVVIDDVESNPLVATARDILLSKGYRAMLVLPLLFGDEVLGTLFLRARRETPFSADEIRFCKVAAGASANALKNALLYTDVKQEAAKHRSTGEKLRSILDGTPDMIVATDPSGTISEFNRGAETLTGRSASRAIGQSLGQLLQCDLQAAPGLGDDEPLDVAFAGADGDRVEISLISAPLGGSSDESTSRVWIGRDVTKLRRVEQSLAQAERLSSLGEVVAGVAHELNNPLSGVVGYAELLRMNATDRTQIRDLDRIVESALRCQKIVIKLLSFARQHPPEKKYQSLNDCVSQVLDLKGYHLRSSQIETVLELMPELPKTCFDFHQLEQVILNLLNNAEHAIGSIRSPGRVVLRTGHEGERVWVEVEDNGPGVPAAVRHRVFDPFFTTKELGMGTGLGLSVSYGIVEEHEGRIELEAVAEGGVRFRVWLPLIEDDETQVDPEPTTGRDTVNLLAGRRILIAEDEPVVLEVLSRLLRHEGAEVAMARDGQEAWSKLEQEEFDLIIADMRMPNLNGQQLYERAAEERPELLRRFVFATGDLAREETVSFLERLPNRILPKPLEVETVRRILTQAIAGPPH